MEIYLESGAYVDRATGVKWDIDPSRPTGTALGPGDPRRAVHVGVYNFFLNVENGWRAALIGCWMDTLGWDGTGWDLDGWRQP